jgi:hypothetical protein
MSTHIARDGRPQANIAQLATRETTQQQSYDCGAKQNYTTHMQNQHQGKIYEKGKHTRTHYFMHDIISK